MSFDLSWCLTLVGYGRRKVKVGEGSDNKGENYSDYFIVHPIKLIFFRETAQSLNKSREFLFEFN